jgi:hypothetical protein
MLNNTLNSLPTTLDETYSRILRAILQFLTFSKRPLRIEEAVDMIAVNVKRCPYFSP